MRFNYVVSIQSNSSGDRHGDDEDSGHIGKFIVERVKMNHIRLFADIGSFASKNGVE